MTRPPSDAIAALEAENDRLTSQRDDALAEVRTLREQLSEARTKLLDCQRAGRGGEVRPRGTLRLLAAASEVSR